jgi:hypothetical protein
LNKIVMVNMLFCTKYALRTSFTASGRMYMLYIMLVETWSKRIAQ